MQKENPPTHLIRSRNGDYLRGRLIKLDATKLQVEIRLEPREIARDRLSLIIWLHPDELDPARTTTATATPAGAGTRVQAVCNDGIRLTFVADRFAGMTLSGKSDVLGPCQVALKDIGQLLIGGGIKRPRRLSPISNGNCKTRPSRKRFKLIPVRLRPVVHRAPNLPW